MRPFAGTGLLLRLAIRRDRLMVPLWIVAMAGTVAATISSFDGLYPDQAGRATFAASIQGNLAFRAFYGPLFGADSNGALTAWRVGTLGAVILGLMSIFVVTRHTRREEEDGRLDLVGAGAIGRLAPLSAATALAVAANLAAGVLSTVALVAQGEPAGGSLALGAALTGGGLVFTGFAAAAAQVTETARAANGLAVAVLGLGFVLRAVGDSASAAGPIWVSWLSPIGWVEQVRAFDGDRFWVLVLPLATAFLLCGIAFRLNTRRDVGGSLLRTRSGPAYAAASLTGPLALDWRRQRGQLIGWIAAFAVLGAVFGAVAGSIGDLIGSSPQLAEVLQQIGGVGALTESYFAGILGVIALISAAFGVSSMLRLRTDETALLVEPVLATSVSRGRLLIQQLVYVFVAPAGLMVLAGLATGSAADAVLTDRSHLGIILVGALAQIPAIWVVGAVATLLFGLLPRWSAVGWGALALAALITEVGPAIGLPQLLMDVSPFTHVPRITSSVSTPALPLLVLGAVAVVLTALGAVGFRRRDIG